MTVFETTSLITSLLSILVSIALVIVGSRLSKSVDIKLSLYNLTNEEQSQIVKNLFELEYYIDSLLEKYETNTGGLLKKISLPEKQEINKYISNVNVGLAKIYITMPDERYKNISKNWSLEPKQLQEMRTDLIVLFRQAQFPKTMFNQRTDIKNIHRIN